MKYINIAVLGLVVILIGVDIYIRLHNLPDGCCVSVDTASNSCREKADAGSLNAISLDTAIQDIKRYRQLLLSAKDENGDSLNRLFAYTVHSADMLEAMGLSLKCLKDTLKFSAVRFYLGVDSARRFKVMLTPVQDSDFTHAAPGSDYIYPCNSVEDRSQYGSGYVFDLNAPCPLTCDQKSPLFTESHPFPWPPEEKLMRH